MSRRDAERLNGKLTFALSYVAYRVGRGVMQPLIRWASGHPRAQQSTSWQAVDKALAFLITLLSLLPPRIFRLRGAPPRPCVKVWTDAAWEPTSTAPATVGIVVYIPPEAGQRGRYLYSSMVVPEEYMQQFQVRRQYIGQLELLAAVAAYTTFHAELRDRRVIHWIDNTSALAGLIRGYAGAIAIERVGASVTAQAGMVGPVFTIALGALLLGEPFSVWVAAGTALVLVGVAWLARLR